MIMNYKENNSFNIHLIFTVLKIFTLHCLYLINFVKNF